MREKAQRPPAGEPFVWQTLELRRSDAWRSAGINARRFVDFLLIEHMVHGGQENGRLKAPHRQLQTFGIPVRCIADAIREAEELGLVDCERGGIRIATRFAITWLPLHDGTPASNRWRTYCKRDLAPSSERPSSKPQPQPKRETKNWKSASQNGGKPASQSEGRWIKSASQSEGSWVQNSASQSEGAYNKRSYHNGAREEVKVGALVGLSGSLVSDSHDALTAMQQPNPGKANGRARRTALRAPAAETANSATYRVGGGRSRDG